MTEPFSTEWCSQMSTLWPGEVQAAMVDPEGYNYIVEWGETDTNTQAQSRAEKGVLLEFVSGKKFSDDECDFIIYASRQTWDKLGKGEVDPMEPVATGDVVLRKGDVAVVAKYVGAWVGFIGSMGKVPTNW